MLQRLGLLSLTLLAAGCATGTTAQWRAGAKIVDEDAVATPVNKSEVQVFLKKEFGAFEEVESSRHFMCASTTVLRKSFLVPGSEKGPAPPDRNWEVVAELTTEEFPRDEEKSDIEADTFSSGLFGKGIEPHDLFEVQLDPAFQDDALDRLRYFAARLGADAVIGVFATGEAEHHMWEGDKLGLNSVDTSHPIYVSGKLLDFRLRDVRLHGIAVRYVD